MGDLFVNFPLIDKRLDFRRNHAPGPLPPAPPPPSAHLDSGCGRARVGPAPAVSPLGQGQVSRPAPSAAHPVSTSMVGRILSQMKRQGRLIEPLRRGVAGSPRAPRPRPYAVVKPKPHTGFPPAARVRAET